jgi:hypothetical protein
MRGASIHSLIRKRLLLVDWTAFNGRGAAKLPHIAISRRLNLRVFALDSGGGSTFVKVLTGID